MTAHSPPLLVMRGIRKEFPGLLALDSVDFDLRPGEVHALLGENGAGKSTLMQILAGMYRMDAGSILLRGELVDFASPLEAIQHRVGMVYQHFTLVPELTVLENILLGSPLPFHLNLKKHAADVQAILDQYGIRIDLEAKVWQLTTGEQQRVEILKCFYRKADLLILDEPTAVLTPPEIEELFAMIRRVVEQGSAVVFISHKLHEVMTLADRITVFRKGCKVGCVDATDASEASLTRLMVGKDVDLEGQPQSRSIGEIVLRVEDLHAQNDKKLPALQGLSLELHRGEILGIAGISGNGQFELAEVLTGLRRPEKGTIQMHGKNLAGAEVRDFIDEGISHVPAKRLHRGLVPLFGVTENAILKDYGTERFARKGLLRRSAMTEYAQKLVDAYAIATAHVDKAVFRLSGGNQQKVVLARELSRNPEVLIAVNPTQGLDVGAISFVQDCLVEQRDAGVGVLLISSELDEVLRLADRVAVIREGRFAAIFERHELDRDRIGLLMAGGRA